MNKNELILAMTKGYLKGRITVLESCILHSMTYPEATSDLEKIIVQEKLNILKDVLAYIEEKQDQEEVD